MIRPLPEKVIDSIYKAKLKEKYDRLADQRVHFRKRNRYYYEKLLNVFRFLIPENKTILEIGCADGYLISHLNPRKGLGIDFSSRMLEQAQRTHGHPRIRYRQADIEAVEFTETFEFVILSDLLGDLLDIQKALENLRTACDEETRIILNYHSIFWEPVLKLSEKLGLKMPQQHSNWLSKSDIDNLLLLSDFEEVRFDRKLLLPKMIPLVSDFLNAFVAPLPLFNSLCLSNFLVIRKKPRQSPRAFSVSIMIPCRNERGNIEAAVQRLPEFGSKQEILFVEGHSKDGTAEEVRKIIRRYPRKDISLHPQKGEGKGDAVRLGFSKAKHDVLMILDADLTVPPEDLPKFYNALTSGKGEFINGCRLVYPLEDEAMRFLNILGNKFFAIMFSWLLNQNIRDTLCGTKALFRKDYEKICEGRKYFGEFDPFGDYDLIFGASKLNLKMIEIPIKYRARPYGTTNISRFRHGWLLFRMTIFALKRLKFN